MSDQTDGIGPWPRAGEIWVPAMPWPTNECPVNLYVYSFSTSMAGGGDGWTWGILEHPEMTFEIGRPPKPLSRERAVMEAWELCYGAATMKAAQVRVGPGAVLVEAVGALWIYVRNEEGRTVRIPARDLRLGFARVDTVEIVEHGYGEDEPRQARAKMTEWEWNDDFDCWVWRPLITWTEQDVIDIHTRHGLKPNPLYLRGSARVGCYPCIYARKAEIAALPEAVVERLAPLERELTADATARGVDRPERAFFHILDPVNGTEGFMPIALVREWAQTDHGGKQLKLLDTAEPGCMRWGLCEHLPDIAHKK